MQASAWVSFVLLSGLTATASTEISLDEYRARRAALREAHGNAITLLFGGIEKDHGDIRNGFFQESHFFYLTGWREPGAILIMTPESEFLLIPKRDEEKEKWTGRKLAPPDPDAKARTGFTEIMPSESFEAELPKWLKSASKVYALDLEAVKKLVPAREVADAAPALIKLRMVKSPAELSLMRKSIEASIAAHKLSWKKIAAGMSEYQIASAMSNAYFEQGCERHAYAPIVGSGPNSVVLHYSKNSRRMDRGELLLMDVGAECNMYAADITRTVPVGGKFTRRQKELYEIVLGAQKAAIAAVKPGMTISKTGPNSLYKIALDYLNSHGKDLHGQTLGRYFTHGLGHHIGLDVHDAADNAMPLTEGMVITVEPGLYIPEEAIGIRVEDMVLVTATGGEVLTSSLPREAADLEKALTR